MEQVGWSDFTNAVHWLVDDTSWDRYHEQGDERFNPTAYIGLPCVTTTRWT